MAGQVGHRAKKHVEGRKRRGQPQKKVGQLPDHNENNHRKEQMMYMENVVAIDIETIPMESTTDQLLADALKSCPRNRKDPQKWAENNWLANYRGWALEPLKGRVLSVAVGWWGKDNAREVQTFGPYCKPPTDNEYRVLEQLEQWVDKWTEDAAVPQWVGHSVRGFDMPFLRARCLLTGRRRLSLAFKCGRWDDKVYDTREQWPVLTYNGRPTSAQKLTDIVHAIDPEMAKGDIDGSKVFDLYAEDRLDEIREYNADDVRRTMLVYELLEGAGGCM